MPFSTKPAHQPRNAALQKLIDMYGVSAIARAIDPKNLTKQAVYAWPRVPERWVELVAKTFHVSCHKLRPDLYARNGKRIIKGRWRWTAVR